MGRELTDLSFEAWIAYLFDQPLTVPTRNLLDWRRWAKKDIWKGSPDLIVTYITRAFEQASIVLEPFSDQQLRQGLWFLIKDNHVVRSDQCSDHLYALYNVKVPRPERERCLSAMYTLFEHLFASRCSPHLSHLGEMGAHPLNAICYEWWHALFSVSSSVYGFLNTPSWQVDLPPAATVLAAKEDAQESEPLEFSRDIDEAILAVLKRILDLDSDACWESALHGLSYWAGMDRRRYSPEVKEIVERFLTRQPNLRPALKTYALKVLEPGGNLLADLTFEEWITYVFDHPVRDPCLAEWYHDLGSDYWDESRQPEGTVAYLTHVFEQASTVLAPFADAQVEQGFWFLLSNACSNHMFALLNPSVPWPDRKRCISSMYTLFEQFFGPRCSSHLSHLDTIETERTNESPLNGVCYMWWDLMPIYGKPEEPDRAELDATCLEVMRMILDLDSDACHESALHGLGHWHLEYPKQVEAIIDRFLDRNPDLGSEVKDYARAARAGRVL